MIILNLSSFLTPFRQQDKISQQREELEKQKKQLGKKKPTSSNTGKRIYFLNRHWSTNHSADLSMKFDIQKLGRGHKCLGGAGEGEGEGEI